jgi:hypothetical protein
MMIIGIMGVVALISTQLYVDMSRNYLRLVQQQQAQQRFDLAVRQLRSDVWNASSALINERGELRLTRVDGKRIQWNAGDRLDRTCDGQSSQHWNELGTSLSFAMRGATIIIREEPSPADPTGGQIAMPMVAATVTGDLR